jgi:hypothetical protein
VSLCVQKRRFIHGCISLGLQNTGLIKKRQDKSSLAGILQSMGRTIQEGNIINAEESPADSFHPAALYWSTWDCSSMTHT